ncbi:MAG: tetratricopeptide (TPR) repeat protein [Pseudohongiellaceae bacterium]
MKILSCFPEMREHRQQLVFIVVLLVVGFLTWLKIDDGYTPLRVPRAAAFEERALVVPPAVVLESLADDVAGQLGELGRGRSAFAPPRDLLPMSPLVLPALPVPAVPVMRPTVATAMTGEAGRIYRLPSESLGALMLSDSNFEEAQGLGGVGQIGDVDDEARSSASAATTSAGARLSPGDQNEDDQSQVDHGLRYDWVQRIGSQTRLYGRLLNDDVYGLLERPTEVLIFQQITTRTGRPLGVPFEFDRALDVEIFGLARTFSNLYHLESRRLGQGAGSVAARSDLALAMLAAADREEEALSFATSEARLAYAASPLDPKTMRLLATVLHRAHDVEGELQVYRDGQRDNTLDGVLLAEYAGLLLELGLSQRADVVLGQAEASSSTAAEIDYQRGRQALLQGDHALALASFEKAAAGSFSAPFREGQRHEASLAYGRALVSMGRLDQAEREAERLLSQADAESQTDVDALGLRGAVFAARGQWSQAAESFSLGLLEASENHSLMADSAIVAWRLGEGDRALELLDRAVVAGPASAFVPLLAMGFIHEDGGDHSAAREFYHRALRLQPDDPRGLLRLGRLERLDGDPEASRTSLRLALRLGGPSVLLLSELGLSAMLLGKGVEAGDDFSEALRLEPDNGLARWLLGLAQLRQGDVLSAVDTLREATAAGQAGAHGALAVAYYQLGNAEAALDEFDEVSRAFAGDEDHPVARYAQEQAAAIRDNLSKRQWVDHFGRSSLQRGWIERQWDGSPSLSHALGEALVIAGRMEKPRDDERPGVTRVVEGRSFLSAEIEASDQSGGNSRFGLSLTLKQVKGVLGQLPKARLEIWVDESGQVRLAALDNFETIVLPGDAVPELLVPPGTSVHLGIERIDGTTGTYGFLVDGRRVGSPVTLKALRDVRRNTLHLDLFGEAAPGRVCQVDVTRARIVRRL